MRRRGRGGCRKEMIEASSDLRGAPSRGESGGHDQGFDVSKGRSNGAIEKDQMGRKFSSRGLREKGKLTLHLFFSGSFVG